MRDCFTITVFTITLKVFMFIEGRGTTLLTMQSDGMISTLTRFLDIITGIQISGVITLVQVHIILEKHLMM